MDTKKQARVRGFRRAAGIVGAALAIGIGLGSSVSAQRYPQRVQSAPAAVGSYAWQNDGWCYVFDGRQWQRTEWRRTYPDGRNPHIYDLYQGRSWVKRVDTSRPGWIGELWPSKPAPGSWLLYPTNTQLTAANVFVLVHQRQWVTLAQLQAMASGRANLPITGDGISGYQGGVVGGYGSSPTVTGGDRTLYAAVLGGITAATQRTATQAQIEAALYPGRQATIAAIIAPNCNASYLGCR
jgi:hypothetical protein